MRQTGSKPHRLRTVLLAATLVAVIAAVAWTLLRDYAAAPSAPVTGATSATGASENSADQRTSADRTAGRSKPATQVRHAIATTALPASGTPLAQIYDELKARADAGDAQAATRVYHDVHRCVIVRKYRQSTSLHLPYVLELDLAGFSAEQRTLHDGMLKELQGELDYIQANAELCADASDEQLNSIVPLSLRAAQLGDLKALDCYLANDFIRMPGLLDHPEWLTQFKDNAPALVDEAMRQGDWVSVELMRHAYSGTFSDSLRGQLLPADPVMRYRYLQLERLGASGDFIAKLDKMIAEAAPQMSEQQIEQAKAWAQEEYTRHFDGTSSNEVSNGANVCQLADD